MALSYYKPSLSSDLHKKSQSVSLTLPITCQICLGKVKEPVVCPNLHAFCSICIEIWLEKSKHCPACRIPISKDNPCRKILGGCDSNDDLILPTEFSNSSTRKARFYALFNQYEDEISRLVKQIDALNNEICELKDPNRFNTVNIISNEDSSPQKDMIQLLKIKLEQLQVNYEEISKERDRLKESNIKLECENSLLIQDIQRLKTTINETKSQMTSRYTVAAMESKLEIYEREIKQLQKALEKSDNYILELENTYLKKKLSPKSIDEKNIFNNNNSSPITSPKIKQEQENNMNYVKVDNLSFKNDFKSVKFNDTVVNAEKISSKKSSKNSKGSYNNVTFVKPPSISNFYGSPKKKLPQNTPTNIVSFNDRLKKNLSFDLESPSPLTQSFNVTNNETTSSSSSTSSTSSSTATTNNEFLSDNSNVQNVISAQHDFLFSPMKRLRLEEVHLEKPNESIVTIKEEQSNKSNMFNMTLTPEFNDCLQLLNEAENKVQSRQTPTKHQSIINLTSSNDKYYHSLSLKPEHTLSNGQQSSCLKLINNKLSPNSNKYLITNQNNHYDTANGIYASNSIYNSSVEPNPKI